MNPHIVTDQNPNEHFGVRACSFAGQQKSPDCAGKWFAVPLQQVRVANPLAPHVCVCEKHLADAHAAVSPPPTIPAPPKRKPRARAAVEPELSL